MAAWTDLPLTLIHGDCWPANAVCTTEGSAILIDWDSAGIGPAILDLGYLLVACHLGKLQLPIICPDAVSIHAVLEGYCRHRTLIGAERAYLPDAVRFGIAYLGTRHLARALEVGADEDLFMRKIQARWAAADEIIRIANRYLLQRTA